MTFRFDISPICPSADESGSSASVSGPVSVCTEDHAGSWRLPYYHLHNKPFRGTVS